MISNRRRFRRHWLRVHSTLALSVGLLFVLTGITGSLNVIGHALDHGLNPELTVSTGSGAERSPDELIAAVKAAHPRRFGAWRLELPQSPGEPAIAWFDKPTETSGEAYAPLMVAIDPYTGRILANRFWGHTFASWIYKLHSQLLLDGFGRALAGLIGLALLASLVSGLRLWLPGKHRLRQSLTLKPKARFKRRVFDLHRVVGIYGAPILLTAALTGVHLAYPAVLETLFGASDFGHHEAAEAEEIISAVPASGAPLNLAQAILIARGLFPNASVDGITTPRTSNGMYRIDFRRPGEHHALTAVWVDPYSGQIRQVRNSANFGPAQRRINALRLLHNGSLLGLPGQALWFLAGLLPFALYLTGIVHWLHKHGIEVERFVPRLPDKYAGTWRQYFAALRPILAATAVFIMSVARRIVSHVIDMLQKIWLAYLRRNTDERRR